MSNLLLDIIVTLYNFKIYKIQILKPQVKANMSDNTNLIPQKNTIAT